MYIWKDGEEKNTAYGLYIFIEPNLYSGPCGCLNGSVIITESSWNSFYLLLLLNKQFMVWDSLGAQIAPLSVREERGVWRQAG